MPGRLEDTVNIGPALAHDLRGIGIEDVEALRSAGALDAWVRLNGAGTRDCLCSLLALEGAVRGVNWMEISPADRDAVAEAARAALAVRAGGAEAVGGA
ncbi:MAG TPA: TfoX/Sxy family DNA transformation protein [Baekduia sp.]|uniref:TfoX/Sxy family DNA transformation protein n=1 Tax=Baekduia sp. TaxID=2600305 RepID=UPI002CD237E2|nr:TfoX/Sxy family DNA transformation protein [Baekduia sp.]HMJ32490.1 TfoX/Sxy family DNA transformation protein [Baekduia sp.]